MATPQISDRWTMEDRIIAINWVINEAAVQMNKAPHKLIRKDRVWHLCHTLQLITARPAEFLNANRDAVLNPPELFPDTGEGAGVRAPSSGGGGTLQHREQERPSLESVRIARGMCSANGEISQIVLALEKELGDAPADLEVGFVKH